MPTLHKVKQGEDITSIASAHGFSPETLWDDPANNEIKDKRKDGDVLKPGDEITIPDISKKQESVSADARHKFKKKTVKKTVRLQLIDNDEPVADSPYTLDVDGESFSGSTDGDGILEHEIKSTAKKGLLTLDDTGEEFELEFGELDPANEISGVQQRLDNLGYFVGKINGQLSPDTKAALEAFQKENSLIVSGKLDEETQNKITEIHGS